MKKLIHFILLILLLVGCQNQNKYEQVIARADSLMESNQDSARTALVMLDSLKSHEAAMSEHDRMYYQLIYAKGMNKGFVDFTTDSVMKQVVAYYDEHGSANDRMSAYYLLGCTYRDLDKKTLALNCYIKATECADTTRKDCDFNLLARIKGQIGVVFHEAKIHSDALAAFKSCYQYAKSSNDTLLALQALNEQANIYENMGDTLKFLNIKEYIYQQYSKRGMKKYAIWTLCSTISTYINIGKLAKAKRYMDVYARSSGLIDEQEHVLPGMEIYYWVRGNYFLKTGKLDMAEKEYRRLLYSTSQNDEKETACRALHKLYKLLGNNDSIAKYASLALEISDKNHHDSPAIALTQQQYLHESEQARLQVLVLLEKNKYMKLFWGASIMFVVLVFVLFFYNYRLHNYKRTIRLLLKIEEHEQETQTYKKDIEQLQSQVKSYECAQIEITEDSVREVLLHDPTRETIEKKTLLGQTVNKDEIVALKKVLRELLPRFYQVFNLDKLNEKELEVCILTKFYFSTMDVQNLMGLSQGYASTLKKRIGKKVFGIEMTPKEVDTQIHKII